MRGATADKDDDGMNDSMDWTVVQGVDEQADVSMDYEMDQDFVIERYFTDTPNEEEGEIVYLLSQSQPSMYVVLIFDAAR